MKRILSIFLFCFLFEAVVPTIAQARIGGGRSMGRSFGGARGGSSFRSRSNSFQNQPRYNQPNPAYSQPSRQGGGFLRGLAGGIAGGFLGSMLFSSLGLGGGWGSHGGGFGFFDMLLLAGAVFVIFRLMRRKGAPSEHAYSSPLSREYHQPVSQSGEVRENFYQKLSQETPAQAIDEDVATDMFFKMQAAWTRKNLNSVKELIDEDLYETLRHDLEELVRSQKTNRLENISIRSVDVGEPFVEDGYFVCPVRFKAILLDYTVDDKTSQVVAGSDTHPVKFEEIWTFRRAAMLGSWQLAAIDQP